MMLFDSSTRSELAKSFGVTLVVILTIMLTSTLIRTLERTDPGEDWKAVARGIAGGSPGADLKRGQAETVITRLRERLKGAA